MALVRSPNEDLAILLLVYNPRLYFFYGFPSYAEINDKAVRTRVL